MSVPGAAPPPKVESTAARMWTMVLPSWSIWEAWFTILTQVSQNEACSSYVKVPFTSRRWK